MMHVHSCSGDGDEDKSEEMKSFFGPGQIDQILRQAVQMCWMALPKDKQNVEEVERQARRLLDRALRDLREDAQEFGCR